MTRRALIGAGFSLWLFCVWRPSLLVADCTQSPSGQMNCDRFVAGDQNVLSPPRSNYAELDQNNASATPVPTPGSGKLRLYDADASSAEDWRLDYGVTSLPFADIVRGTRVVGADQGLYAQVWLPKSGSTPTRIEVWPHSAKTNEGAAGTAGTIAWALAQLTNGGEVYLHTGIYPITTTLAITAPITLRCEQPDSTTLRLGTSANTTLVAIGTGGASKLQGVTIENCGFDGNPDNNSSGTLLTAADVADLRIVRNFFRYWITLGVKLTGSSAQTGLVENAILDNYFFGDDASTGSALQVDADATNDPTDTRIEGNDIGGGPATATTNPVVSITAGAGLIFRSNHIYGGSGNGFTNCVTVNSPAFGEVQITGNEIENCHEHCLAVTSGAHGIISDNDLYRCGESGTDPNWYDGIHLTADNYIVANNTIRGGGSPTAPVDDGIELADSDNSTVIGNKFTPESAHLTGYAVRVTAGGTNLIVANKNTYNSGNNTQQVSSKTTDAIISERDYGQEIRAVTGERLARVYSDAAGVARMVEVWPSTVKTDEGDAATPGTTAWATDQLTAGGTIFVHAGIYTVSGANPIVMDTNGTTLHCTTDGRASNGALFKLGAAAGANEILRLGYAGAQRTNLHVIGCGFDVQYGSRTTGTAIAVRDVARSSIEHNEIGYFDTAGIAIDGATAGATQLITIRDNSIHDGDGSAISLTAGTQPPTNIVIRDNELSTGSATATSVPWVNVTAAIGFVFQGNRVAVNGTSHTNCITLDDSAATDIQIEGNVITGCQRHGLAVVAASTNGAIRDNTITLVSKETDDTYSAIALNANQWIVTNNTVRGSSSANGGRIHDAVVGDATSNSTITGTRFQAGTGTTGCAVRITSGGTNWLANNVNTLASSCQTVQKDSDRPVREVCAVLENLTAADDAFEFWQTKFPVQVTSVGCRCRGTCSTPATFALANRAATDMTITGTNPTCATTGAATYTTVTANNTLAAGDGINFSVTNIPTTGDTYTLCIGAIESK